MLSIRFVILLFALLLASVPAGAQDCERSYDEFDQAEEIDCTPADAEYLQDNRRPLPKVWAYWREKSDSYGMALQIYTETRDALRFIRADRAQLIVDQWHGSRRVDPQHDGYVYVHLPLDSTMVHRVARADTMRIRIAGWPFDVSAVIPQVARLLEMTTGASFLGVPQKEISDKTEKASAPYNIEGLDREPQFAPLPAYTEEVNARIRVRITVNPEGRIINRVPLTKRNPKLESAAMDALQRWRFNPLPADTLQENQKGTITFTFQLE